MVCLKSREQCILILHPNQKKSDASGTALFNSVQLGLLKATWRRLPTVHPSIISHSTIWARLILTSLYTKPHKSEDEHTKPVPSSLQIFLVCMVVIERGGWSSVLPDANADLWCARSLTVVYTACRGSHLLSLFHTEATRVRDTDTNSTPCSPVPQLLID